jgi:hypothetical protein
MQQGRYYLSLTFRPHNGQMVILTLLFCASLPK